MKEHVHITPALARILLDGSLSTETIERAARLLVAGCPVCLETVRQVALGPDGPGLKSRPAIPDLPGEDPPASG